MGFFGITEQLARFSARRPWRVILAWAVLLAVGGYFAAGLGSVTSSDFRTFYSPDSVKANNLLKERLRGPKQAMEVVVIRSATLTVDDAAFKDFVAALRSDIVALQKEGKSGEPAAASVIDYYSTGLQALVSADRHTTIVPVTLNAEEFRASSAVRPLVDLLKETNGRDGFETLVSGDGSLNEATNETAMKDLQEAEILGVPIALIVLVVVFGAVVAATIPIVLAIFAITVAMGTTALIGRVFELDTLVANMITMIGLAVGIDYSLLVVERFREERRHGLAKLDAIAKAGATASRAVVFSGGTVLISLLGLLIVPEKSFRSIAIGAAVTVVFAVTAALTLLPAALSLLGDHVNKLSLPFRRNNSGDGEKSSGFWARTASIVMRRPLLSVVIVSILLAVAASPVLTMRRGYSGISGLPHNLDVYKAYEILDREFSAGLIAPVEIAIDTTNADPAAVQESIARLQERLKGDDRFGAMTVESKPENNIALLSMPVTGDFAGDEALDTVTQLRNEYIPQAFDGTGAQVYVGGFSALIVDMLNMVSFYTPIVFAVVLGLSFILLLVLFRSIVIPISSLIMNLLSVGAAYGLVVLVFQHGFLANVLGFQQQDRIAFFVPLLLFTILFGLSMDYQVFLLSRIRERYDETGRSRSAVAYGIRRTGRIITGAALIMVVVFGAFAMGDMVSLQQAGFGLAVAIIVDATVVRSVLVPAVMALLGRWNWYLPFWLQWLPEVRLEQNDAESRD